MKKGRKKGLRVFLVVMLLLFAVAAIGAVLFFSRYGGLTDSKCADKAEFAKYAGKVDDIVVPEQTRIVALGEATHGNADFQQFKLEVFKLLIEKYGVRAFALEGDYGGCEAVNRYIHGGEGTAREAAAAIGFTLYNTEQMDQLIAWMREYNATAQEGEDLRFYGFDMQNIAWNYYFLVQAAEERGVDASALKQLWDEEKGMAIDACTTEQWVEAIATVKDGLEQLEGTERSVHHADILIQNCGLGKAMATNADNMMTLRDGYMADNVRWILAQEEVRGNRRIFVTAHNGHIERLCEYGTAGKSMGNLLADEYGDEYFAIGTDFWKSRCNLPNVSRTKRRNCTFYSHDPLAKASKKCGYDISWLDFSRVPSDSPLRQSVDGNIWMGSIGEASIPLMPLLPMTYRIKGVPASLYDGMIFVSEARPTAPRVD